MSLTQTTESLFANNERKDSLYNRLLVGSTEDHNKLNEELINANHSPLPYNVIVPEPGFCAKLKDDKNSKIFINVCHSPKVPVPNDITETELIQLLESDDPSNYRIPMSVGEGHAEVDRGGHGCTAYDIIIHPDFYKKITDNELFKTFFLTVSIEGLEHKYNHTLARDWVILKNKKFMGSLVEQNVRASSTPLIQDLSQYGNYTGTPLISEVEKKNEDKSSIKKPTGDTPQFTIMPEPQDSYPEFLVAEINLPLIKTAESLSLEVGEDRLLLTTRSDVYHLDIYLPYYFIQEQTVSQLNRKTKVLTVTLTVAPENVCFKDTL